MAAAIQSLYFITARPQDVKTSSIWVNTASNIIYCEIRILNCLNEIRGDWLVVEAVAKLACRETARTVSRLRWLDAQRIETMLDWSAKSKASLVGY